MNKITARYEVLKAVLKIQIFVYVVAFQLITLLLNSED